MWEWWVDSRTPEYALERLAVLLSSEGLTSFLGTEVGPYLKERAQARFQQEGDDVSGKWAPLKEATVNIRLSQNFGGEHPINRRTGELEDWVVNSGWRAYPLSTGAAMAYPGTQPSPLLAEKVETAQRGRADPNTVARPVLGVNENDMLFFISMFASNIAEGVR